MGRRGEACGRCGARRHGKRRHVNGSAAMAVCARSDCGKPICEKHAEWSPEHEAWICAAHKREQRRG